MSTPEQYQLMARYNRWMNRKLYAICADVADADRKKDLGAFFKSVHGTLNHLLYGDRAWLGRFIGQPFNVTVIGQELYTNFAELRREREITDAAILTWSENLDPRWLAADFTYTSNVDGKTRVLPTWILVTHLFNHQTHHRGQVTTLMKQLGRDPGETDIPWMPEFGGPAV
jgi:uncharacterized damage-inducible protein DinB